MPGAFRGSSQARARAVSCRMAAPWSQAHDRRGRSHACFFVSACDGLHGLVEGHAQHGHEEVDGVTGAPGVGLPGGVRMRAGSPIMSSIRTR
jgi:hypothetical protein